MKMKLLIHLFLVSFKYSGIFFCVLLKFLPKMGTPMPFMFTLMVLRVLQDPQQFYQLTEVFALTLIV